MTLATTICLAVLSLLFLELNVYVAIQIRRLYRQARQEQEDQRYRALESVEDILRARWEEEGSDSLQ
jgi:hypothetical protein